MREIDCGGAQALVNFTLNGSFGALREDIERYQKEPDSLTGGEETIAGALFENLAYDVLKDRMPEGIELLSPDTTLDYYRHYLHPDVPVRTHPFTTSLDGISVPDGIAIQSNEEVSHIGMVLEYTLNREASYFHDKYHAFCIDRRKHPQVFADTQLIFVTPCSESRRADIHRAKAIESLDRRSIRVWTLAVSRGQFSQFVRNIASGS